MQVKRNKELIATNIQEIYNPFQIAQVFQPVDLQALFNLQNPQGISAGQMLSQMSPIPQTQQPQPIPIQAQQQPIQMNGGGGEQIAGLTNGVMNPMLNGTTIVTSSNMNVTYLNASAAAANKLENAEKFKMHQGFIAVLKVSWAID